MARSGSGKPSNRYGPRRAASVAGCTRPPTSSTNCRRASNRKPSAAGNLDGRDQEGCASGHRTVVFKGCLLNKTGLAIIFKVARAAEKSWRRLNGHNQLPKIILGIKFTDGIEVVRSQAQTAAACSLPSQKF